MLDICENELCRLRPKENTGCLSGYFFDRFFDSNDVDRSCDVVARERQPDRTHLSLGVITSG